MAISPLQILPAVDLKGGEAVQLQQGVADSGWRFGDAISAAKRWEEAGARWLHLVDLDAAFGSGSNADLAARIISQVDMQVELSGGIRDDASLESALATGCTRVNIGTAAIENLQWTKKIIARYGEKIAISLDVRGEHLAGRAWTTLGGTVWDLLEKLKDLGVSRYVVTDVSKDGMLGGPNLELLQKVCEYTQSPVVASGGVASLDDVRALQKMTTVGIEGAIIGSALYKGFFTLEQALEAAKA